MNGPIRYLFIIAPLAAILWNLSPPVAEAKDKIVWDISIEPPITYQENVEFTGYGIAIMRLIQNELEDYDHQIQVAGNYKRLALEVERGPLTCALGFFKTDERLKVMHFSKVPVFYFFNIQLVLRKKLFEEMGRPSSISLREMLGLTQYRLGISKGRTYSDTIRAILDEFAGAPNIYVGAQGNVAKSLLQMLNSRRIDYMFLYPEEAVYLSRKLGFESEIVTVPIEEAEALSSSWAACTKNKAGMAAIKKITEALIKVRQGENYRDLYESWISCNLQPTYQKMYKEHFLHIYEE